MRRIGWQALEQRIESFRVFGDHGPAHAGDEARGIGLRFDHAAGEADGMRAGEHHALDLELAIRHVGEQHAVGREVPPVDRKGLARQQVDGDRIARECVENQHVERLRRLVPQGGAAIAEHDLRLRRCVAQERERGGS